ncbi:MULTISPECIES: TetR/AcrR family transcriptional regulator [unclassified Yoonia]|uniref:TetR/AcrR family transcriptional regulator n=1 Tax=unclassified Yoonia TaxID=2629118 RepID=UPI002AFE534E|nr:MULTISPECIES: TetR/AcrR family transcriptional regulator [unclassified Yoonia]
MKNAAPPAKAGYHHGNLKAALVEAADAILRDKGVEGFSLREAARRAGVSIGAPAHHFGSATGLLTEVALLGYDSLGEALNAVAATDDPAADLRALALAYVRFALAYPGRFRLMFRQDLVNRDDPRYATASTNALSGFAAAIMRRDTASQDMMAEVFVVWSSIHGMANLVVDGKAKYLFGGATPDAFAEDILPGLLEDAWPFGRAN